MWDMGRKMEDRQSLVNQHLTAHIDVEIADSGISGSGPRSPWSSMQE